eukprot:scaffold311822_cov18-Prasinocladus_malaysianus.AAC.1
MYKITVLQVHTLLEHEARYWVAAATACEADDRFCTTTMTAFTKLIVSAIVAKDSQHSQMNDMPKAQWGARWQPVAH